MAVAGSCRRVSMICSFCQEQREREKERKRERENKKENDKGRDKDRERDRDGDGVGERDSDRDRHCTQQLIIVHNNFFVIIHKYTQVLLTTIPNNYLMNSAESVIHRQTQTQT